jgi:hypothetical protein
MGSSAGRWSFRIIAVVLLLWTLLGVQGIGYAIADGESPYVPGVVVWLLGELALVYLLRRTRPGGPRA